MKKLLANVLLLLITVTGKVDASSFEAGAEYDFQSALSYAWYASMDTIILTTSGDDGVYMTSDTTSFLIEKPLVIIAREGLSARPVITHPNKGRLSGEPSSSMEIFRVLDDVEFNGIALMGGIDETDGCKYGVRYADHEDPVTGAITRAKSGTRIFFRNCHFEGFHSLKDQNAQGNVLYFMRPVDENLSLTNLSFTKVLFENCTFKDIGDEAIRISENEKYGGSNGITACDSLVIRNCTFDDIDAECVRIYADKDTSMTGSTPVDGTVLIENVTVVNSSPRFIYAKNYRGVTVRNILVAHGRGPSANRGDRGDYVMQVQLSGSTISHIDTFDLYFTLPEPGSGRIGATKGGTVVDSTIYNYDPMFVDYENGDYTLASGSPLYYIGFGESTISDLNWATNPPLSTDGKPLPGKFSLRQNYPNPFNPQTTIEFTLDRQGIVVLTVYDILGRQMSTLVNNTLPAGPHAIRMEASSFPAGVYFYELRTNKNIQVRKMLLVK